MKLAGVLCLLLACAKPPPAIPSAPPAAVDVAVACPKLETCRDEFVDTGSVEALKKLESSLTDDRRAKVTALIALVDQQDVRLGTAIDPLNNEAGVKALAELPPDDSTKPTLAAFEKANASHDRLVRASAITVIVPFDAPKLDELLEAYDLDAAAASESAEALCDKAAKLAICSGSAFASISGTLETTSGEGIGMGTPGTLGHGAGTGSGYGVGSGSGGTRGRRAAVPQVRIGQPTANGDLDKAIIRRYVKRNSSKITYCYEKQLLARPSLEGTVNTQFFIANTGTVVDSRATGVDPEVASCVAAVIKSIEFPKPKGGGGVQVNYPFNFRPTGG